MASNYLLEIERKIKKKKIKNESKKKNKHKKLNQICFHSNKKISFRLKYWRGC